MSPPALSAAVASVPPGRWGVGVSGGADSVALLTVLRGRPDLSLHIVHLNHQARGEASDGDAAFVRELAREAGLPFAHATIAQVLPALPHVPANPSARYRAARLAFFAQSARAHALDGVLLAHHADDQAETVLHRLLRGSGFAGLAGMAARSRVGGVVLLRPLLTVRRGDLRADLARRGRSWREDASNATDAYARNRLREFLAGRDDAVRDLLALGGACAALRAWQSRHAPDVGESLRASDLDGLPDLLARAAAAAWLRDVAAAADTEPGTVARLLAMVTDAATPARQVFPGHVRLRRRGGAVSAERDEG